MIELAQIQVRREALGWTRQVLALRARLSVQQVQNIEAGRTAKPHAATLALIEAALREGERNRHER